MANNEDLRKSPCTSCMVKDDKSAYWYPQLYWEDADTGKLEMVESSGGALMYVFFRDVLAARCSGSLTLSAATTSSAPRTALPSSPSPKTSA